MPRFVSSLLIFVAVIHLLPVAGVLGSDRLSALYGLSFEDPSLAVLMRHRAVLFGLLGLFLLAAAFRPALQAMAFAAGFVSVASFLCLAAAEGGYNTAIGRVVTADVIALVCLVAGFAARLLARHGG